MTNLSSTLRQSSLALALFALMSAGCTAAVGGGMDEIDEGVSAPTEAPIIGASSASAYPESALVDMYSAGASWPSKICSGAVIAPRVVLTAGHCVEGFVKWRITTPFAGNQTAYGTRGVTYDWAGVSSELVDPNKHDVGLVILDTPITLASYPLVAQTGVAEGTQIVNIGRIQDGTASSTALFVGAPVAVQNGSRVGYPYSYYSNEIIQSGDSGGPDELPGKTPHQIVAVNSGAGSGTQVLARVDLVYAWIDTQVKGNGGWASSTPVPTPTPTPTPTPACALSESEPNDTYTAPDAFGTSKEICGALTGTNQDWFSWTVSATAVSYSMKLAAAGDAQIQMWKLVNGSYYKVANTTPTEITKTSNGAGTYVILVSSPSGIAQTYKLTR